MGLILKNKTNVKFKNGNEVIEGTIIDYRLRGNFTEYLVLEVYGDENQHNCEWWVFEYNLKINQ